MRLFVQVMYVLYLHLELLVFDQDVKTNSDQDSSAGFVISVCSL